MRQVAKMKSDARIIFIFSEVTSSPQILAIIGECIAENINFEIVYFGLHETFLVEQFRKMDCRVHIRRPLTKLGIIQNIPFLFSTNFRFKPSVVFCSGFMASILGIPISKAMNIPNRIFIRHHTNLHIRNRSRLGSLSDKLVAFTATKIVAVSRIVRDVLVSELESNAKKVSLIHNGVNLHKFRSQMDTNSALRGTGHIRVGSIARQTEWKGLEYTARAFAQFNELHPASFYHLIGVDSDASPAILEALSRISSDNFLIQESSNDISEFFRSIDIFIHVPVGPEEEAFGIVYIEALASGVQCIFTKSGILHELTDVDEYAHIVDYRDADQILRAILKISCKLENNRITMGDNLLSPYNLDTMSKKYLSILLK